jgi:hypothetical protein
VRIDGFLGYVDLRYKFYGGRLKRRDERPIRSDPAEGFAFAPELLFKTAPRDVLRPAVPRRES